MFRHRALSTLPSYMSEAWDQGKENACAGSRVPSWAGVQDRTVYVADRWRFTILLIEGTKLSTDRE